MSERGHVFIVSGPSGCGKSTVLGEVFKERSDLYFSVSATTRGPRAGERDGVEYYFLTQEQFNDLLTKDELLEHASFAGNSYGTPRAPVVERLEAGTDVVMDIDVQGARQVKSRLPEAIAVFIAPPSLEELERRLRGRSTESEEKIRLRLEAARGEIAQSDFYDHVVVNDDYRRAAREVLRIMENA